MKKIKTTHRGLKQLFESSVEQRIEEQVRQAEIEEANNTSPMFAKMYMDYLRECDINHTPIRTVHDYLEELDETYEFLYQWLNATRNAETFDSLEVYNERQMIAKYGLAYLARED